MKSNEIELLKHLGFVEGDGNEPECHCSNCWDEWAESLGAFPISGIRMFVCPICGNKRCPHSTDHTLACTGSNEPGQKGSRYE